MQSSCNTPPHVSRVVSCTRTRVHGAVVAFAGVGPTWSRPERVRCMRLGSYKKSSLEQIVIHRGGRRREGRGYVLIHFFSLIPPSLQFLCSSSACLLLLRRRERERVEGGNGLEAPSAAQHTWPSPPPRGAIVEASSSPGRSRLFTLFSSTCALPHRYLSAPLQSLLLLLLLQCL